MENLILQLQILLDEIEHEGLELPAVKEQLSEIVDDANNLYMKDVLPF